MGKYLRARYLEALDAARATLGDVAQALGAGYRTLIAHKAGERTVTPEAARRLVAYLRTRARELEQAADRLEAAVEKEEPK